MAEMDGKVVLVAGAGATDPDGIGNGRAAAILMAEAGARIMCVDRDLALAERTVEMIAERGGEAEAFAADITRNEDCAAMVAATLERFGRLDGLDNNVGISSRGSVVEETEEAWERVMEVNVKGMFLAAKHAVPAMVATAGGGAVVNVSSIAALRPRGLTVYSASKGAVISLTRAMAVDHGGQGVRVNCVAPGPVYTPMAYGAGPGMSETVRRTRADASLLKTEGTGWDIGEAVRFLLSDRSRWITGHTLVVDGGATVRGPERDTV